MKKMRSISLFFASLVILFGNTAFGNAYYVVNNNPWSMSDDITAMNYVFGANWTQANYSTPAATIFSPGVDFVMLQGSDMNGNALADFLNANGPVIYNWINAGGHLFVNAASNDTVQTMSLHFEDYDATITNHIYSSAAHSLDPSHPIFNGPYVPVMLNYTGNYCSHGTVSGPGLTNLMYGNNVNEILLAYRTVGCGTLMIGAITFPYFWSPTTQARNLYYNIFMYGSALVPCAAPTGLLAGGITNYTANLSWSGSGLGSLYVLDQSPAAPVVQDTFTYNFVYMASNLQANTTYYFHVRSICCTDTSDWVTLPFTTVPLPPCKVPNPFYYSMDTITAPFAGTIAWDNDAPLYAWVLDNAAAVPQTPATITADTFAVLSSLAPHTHYYFHVRRICQPGDSSAWVVRDFTTPWPLGIADVNLPGHVTVDCGPNPAKDHVAVNIQGIMMPGASLVLTDMSGKLISNVEMSGKHTNIDISKLAPAVYLLKYKDSGNSMVMKIVKE